MAQHSNPPASQGEIPKVVLIDGAGQAGVIAALIVVCFYVRFPTPVAWQAVGVSLDVIMIVVGALFNWRYRHQMLKSLFWSILQVSSIGLAAIGFVILAQGEPNADVRWLLQIVLTGLIAAGLSWMTIQTGRMVRDRFAQSFTT